MEVLTSHDLQEHKLEVSFTILFDDDALIQLISYLHNASSVLVV